MSRSAVPGTVESVPKRLGEPAADFDPALLGGRCWLRLPDGERIPLAVRRWHSTPEEGDEALLARCAGPTLDVGCGPGRLTAALTARGIPALGVDISPIAVRLARGRGAIALRGDVFGRLPGEGRWRHLLLADGNIGIGGDPSALLSRAGALIASDGTVLVEVDPPGNDRRRGRVRLNDTGRWFPWAWLSATAVGSVAAAAGLRLVWLGTSGRRWFAELQRR